MYTQFICFHWPLMMYSYICSSLKWNCVCHCAVGFSKMRDVTFIRIENFQTFIKYILQIFVEWNFHLLKNSCSHPYMKSINYIWLGFVRCPFSVLAGKYATGISFFAVECSLSLTLEGSLFNLNCEMYSYVSMPFTLSQGFVSPEVVGSLWVWRKSEEI